MKERMQLKMMNEASLPFVQSTEHGVSRSLATKTPCCHAPKHASVEHDLIWSGPDEEVRKLTVK